MKLAGGTLSHRTACYYCGGALRLLCTTVDSERTQLAGDPASTRVDLGAAFTLLRNQVQAVANTAFEGGIVLSARMITKRVLSPTFVDPDTLPYNSSSSSIRLGTTIGSSVVFANDSNTLIANIASNGNAMSKYSCIGNRYRMYSSPTPPQSCQACWLSRQRRRIYSHPEDHGHCRRPIHAGSVPSGISQRSRFSPWWAQPSSQSLLPLSPLLGS